MNRSHESGKKGMKEVVEKNSKKLLNRAKKVGLQIIIKTTPKLNPQLWGKENGNIENYHNSYWFLSISESKIS